MAWSRLLRTCFLRVFPGGIAFASAGCAPASTAAVGAAPECPKSPRAEAVPSARALLELDLEADDPGWKMRGARRVTNHAHTGASSISLRHDGNGTFPMATYELDVSKVRGRRLHLAAWVKTRDVQDGWAGLWVRADRGDQRPFYDTMEDRGLHGSHDWTRVEIVGDIPWDVDRVAFGAFLPGKGSMWVDDFEVTTSLFGEPVRLAGQVTDADGAPVAGAPITIVHASLDQTFTRVSTDEHGRYTAEVPLDTYGVTVVPRGKPAAYRADIHAGLTGDVDLKLPLKSAVRLTGSVVGTNGPGARVQCHLDIGRKGALFEIPTDSTGRFEVGLPKGVYYCVATQGEAGSRPVTIAQQAELQHDFMLATPEPTPEAVVQWLRERSVPLLSAEAGHGDRDLSPLKAAIGNARVVALGEATHGSREIFQLKHRMLEFLVRRMGFSVFAIEANWPETEQLNEYVLTGKGDPRQGLLAIKFWTWNTEEVLALVEWMRGWNADPKHRRKLTFYGVDMQFTGGAGERLQAYFQRVDPELAKSEQGILERFQAGRAASEASDHAERERGVERLAQALEAHRPGYEHAAGARAWKMARRYTTLLRQNLKSEAPGKPDFRERDRAMAENLLWVINDVEPGAKAVFWAHNAHIEEGKALVPSSGYYLKETLGKRYLSIGFVFGRGGFQAVDFTGQRRGLTAFEVGEPPVGSVDEALSRTGWPLSFVDLRRLPTSGPVAEWFQVTHPMREIGSGFMSDKAMQQEVKLQERFDAALFVRSTTRARPLPQKFASQK